jgi:F0F1-type ATP synthase assembly protein I
MLSFGSASDLVAGVLIEATVGQALSPAFHHHPPTAVVSVFTGLIAPTPKNLFQPVT